MPVNPAAPPPGDQDARVADRLAALERQMRNLSTFMQGGSTAQIPVVTALPTAGRKGRLVMLASTNLIYKDIGSGWVTPP